MWNKGKEGEEEGLKNSLRAAHRTPQTGNEWKKVSAECKASMSAREECSGIKYRSGIVCRLA